MKKNILFCFLVSLFSLTNGHAQSIAEIKFSDLLEQLPKPAVDWQQAQTAYADIRMMEVPEDFKTAATTLEDIQKQILTSLYNTFQKNACQFKTNKAFASTIGAEEQRMIRDFGTLSSSWGNDAYFAFSKWIQRRPGITKQSWTGIRQPLSPTARQWYQQLVQLEKELQPQLFLEQAESREGFSLDIPGIREISVQETAALQAVPKKKVKLFEGTDVMADIPDPDKSIAVVKMWDIKKQEAYQNAYTHTLLWWQANYKKAKAAATAMDGLFAATNYGKGLNGNDQQLMPVLADVQCRVITMLWHLNKIGGLLAGVVAEKNVMQAATVETINQLKKLPSQ